MLYLILIVSNLCRFILSTETFNYEKDIIYGYGRRFMENNNWPQEYKKPLESFRTQFVRSPYKSLYQGNRIPKDTRIFNKKFTYTAKTKPHKLLCEQVFECTLTHLAIETEGNKPVLLRGGVGYRHFSAVVLAEAGDALVARVSAYCSQQELLRNQKKTIFW